MKQIILALLVILLITACEKAPEVTLPGTEDSTANITATPNSDFSNVSLLLADAEEDVVGLNSFGLIHTPDGKVNFIKENGKYHVWFAATNEGYYFTGNDLLQISPANPVENGRAVPVLRRSTNGIDSGYAAFGGVVPSQSKNKYLTFYHCEDYRWAGTGEMTTSKFWAQIAYAESADKINWEKEGAVITGRDPKPNLPARAANGAGNPATIVHDGYIYIFYNDWHTTIGNATGPDEIHVARAAVASDGKPGSWYKYYNGQFSEPGIGGNSSPVILAPMRSNPQEYPNDNYAGSVNISYNKYIKSFVAIYISVNGVFYCFSKDLLSWSKARKIENTDNGQLLYPSFLSPSQESDMVTWRYGFLYYGKGEPHNMRRRALAVVVE